MIEAALAGAVAGYAIAIPVGAIAALIIHTAATQDLRHGLAAGAGAATADGVYATIAVLAGFGVGSLIAPVLGPLRIVGGALLVVIGLRGLIALRVAGEAGAARVLREERAHGRTYLTLLGLTLLNPVTVVYFAALTVGLPLVGGLAERAAFAGAAFAASLSWQSVLALFGAALGRGSGHRLRRITGILGNAVVVVLGALVALAGLR
jgi:threonine/homoserine/homoserine lactone efflux protein